MGSMITRDHRTAQPRTGTSDERLVTARPTEPDAVQFENTLRPRTLSEYIGQTEVKKNLIVFLAAAKKRKEPLEHVLIHGPPGLGKTTLAYVMAHEMCASIRTTTGPTIERQGDLAALLTNLKEGDIFFIDEIHRLRPIIAEMLYSAMEDFALDLIIGKGPSARSMRLSLPRFTLIGATTKVSLLPSPLRDRFGNVLRLDFYTEDEITEIIQRSSKILHCTITPQAAHRLAASSRSTPRIANRLLRRMRDFSDMKHLATISPDIIEDALRSLGIDALGLDATDRAILKTIIEKFNGGPVGLNTIAAATSEEEETLEDIYEPFLLKLGLLERTSRGRLATEHAYKHLGISPRKNARHQKQLF